MNHTEAIQEMATERYILDELSPDVREAFEEHFFDCPECALDVRAAATFVQEAKAQLPQLTAAPVAAKGSGKGAEVKPKSQFWAWLGIFSNPTFAAPVFAALLVIVGYQNLVTYPALRMAASEPRLAPTVFLHAGSRGAAHTAVEVDRRQGTALLMDVPQQSGYASFLYELRDPQGRIAVSAATPKDGTPSEGTLSLAIRGDGLEEGTYTLVLSGIAASGERTEISRSLLDFHLKN